MRLIKTICFFVALIFSTLVFAGFSANNFTFNPQYDDSLGFLFNSTYSQLLTPNSAGLLEGDFGNNEYRVAATWGYQLTLAQRIKLTFERLAQRIDYNFASGSVKNWNAQNAFGGDYEILLPQRHLNALDFSGYYAKADSTQLSPVMFNNNTLINFRNIAGATSEGVAAGINFSLWKNALLNTTANYDDLYYHTLYQPANNSSGLGETVSLQQLLSPNIKLKLLQSHREIYDQYEAGLSWLVPVRPTTRLELGFDVSHFASNTALGNDNRFGIELGYQWDLPENDNNVYAAPDATQPDLASWTATPAVHMEQVLTMVDQKTVLAAHPVFLKTATVGSNDPNAPQPTGQQIGNITQSLANPAVSFQIDSEKYFTNPLVKNHTMTFSFGQNCSGSLGTGCLPSNISSISTTLKSDGYYIYTISGTADNQNVQHGTYNIDVYADNGLQAGPIKFGITITAANNGPVYNGNGMTNGEYGQQYSYDLSQDFTPTGTTITAVTGLPTGLTLSGNKVVGQPQQAGVISLTVTAQDNGINIQQPINLTILPHYQGNGMPAGVVNQLYSYDLHTDFLPSNATIAVTGNLPAGLQNNNGIISGTPTVAGTFPLSVVATVNGASTTPQQINLIINPANGPVYNNKGMTNGTYGQQYSYDLSQDFTPAGTTITAVTGLPTGLTLSGNKVTGQPQQAGVTPLTVTAKANGVSIQQPVNLTIVPHYQGNGMPSAVMNQQYSYDLHNDFLPSNATIAVTGLPAGLQSNNGLISGAPTISGNFPLQVTATVNGASTPQTQINLIIYTAPGPHYSGNPLPAADAMLSYSYNLQSQFSPAGVTVTVDASSLPSGLTYANGIISGTPTKAGTYALKVTASLNGQTITPSVSMTVNTSTGMLVCPDSMANPTTQTSCAVINGKTSNVCYNFTGSNISGENWYSSNVSGSNFSCTYGFNPFAKNSAQTAITNGTVSGGACNSSRTSCAAMITYG